MSVQTLSSMASGEVLSSISSYLNDDVYKVRLEDVVTSNSGVFSEPLDMSTDNWREVYEEFQRFDFDPTNVLSNTHNAKAAHVALLFESCDPDSALTATVNNSTCNIVRVILTDGKAIPSQDHLLTCVDNNDLCSLGLLAEDSHVDRETLLNVLLVCIDKGAVDCVRVILDNGDMGQKVITLCLRKSIDKDQYEISAVLIDNMLAPDYDLLNYARDNTIDVIAEMLEYKFDKINSYLSAF